MGATGRLIRPPEALDFKSKSHFGGTFELGKRGVISGFEIPEIHIKKTRPYLKFEASRNFSGFWSLGSFDYKNRFLRFFRKFLRKNGLGILRITSETTGIPGYHE